MDEGMNVARGAALVLGLGYVAAGLIGFIVTGFTGFITDTDEQLLGLDLNIFHNVVHLAIGASLMIASQVRDIAITQGVLIGVGLFYILAALLGFIDYLQIISVNYELSVDNFFHLFTGLTALIFGLIGGRQTQSARRHVATAGGEPRPIEERRAQWDQGTYREEKY